MNIQPDVNIQPIINIKMSKNFIKIRKNNFLLLFRTFQIDKGIYSIANKVYNVLLGQDPK